MGLQQNKRKVGFYICLLGSWNCNYGLVSMLIEALVNGPSLNQRQLVSNILISLWGIRLSIYLFYRNFWIKEDPRYINLQKKIGNAWGFKIYKSIFLYRGFLQLIVIAPIISLNFLPGPNSLNIFDYLR